MKKVLKKIHPFRSDDKIVMFPDNKDSNIRAIILIPADHGEKERKMAELKAIIDAHYSFVHVIRVK